MHNSAQFVSTLFSLYFHHPCFFPSHTKKSSRIEHHSFIQWLFIVRHWYTTVNNRTKVLCSQIFYSRGGNKKHTHYLCNFVSICPFLHLKKFPCLLHLPHSPFRNQGLSILSKVDISLLCAFYFSVLWHILRIAFVFLSFLVVCMSYLALLMLSVYLDSIFISLSSECQHLIRALKKCLVHKRIKGSKETHLFPILLSLENF